jgi:hypothetical protein
MLNANDGEGAKSFCTFVVDWELKWKNRGPVNSDVYEVMVGVVLSTTRDSDLQRELFINNAKTYSLSLDSALEALNGKVIDLTGDTVPPVKKITLWPSTAIAYFETELFPLLDGPYDAVVLVKHENRISSTRRRCEHDLCIPEQPKNISCVYYHNPGVIYCVVSWEDVYNEDLMLYYRSIDKDNDGKLFKDMWRAVSICDPYRNQNILLKLLRNGGDYVFEFVYVSNYGRSSSALFGQYVAAKDGSDTSVCAVCFMPLIFGTKDSVGDRFVGPAECSHLFHVDCALSWLSAKGSCPVCKVTCHTIIKRKDKITWGADKKTSNNVQ